jgi:hypothetical protein
MLFIEHTPTAIAMLDTNMKYLAASKKWTGIQTCGSKNN